MLRHALVPSAAYKARVAPRESRASPFYEVLGERNYIDTCAYKTAKQCVAV